MKKVFFIVGFCLVASTLFGQNQIRLKVGYISTNTSIAEYGRGIDYFYYDSVALDTRVNAPLVSVDLDFDMGKRFFFSTGLSYLVKGVTQVQYTGVEYWYGARQEYLGVKFQLKYHYKFNDQKFGVFAASGFRTDFAVGGPTSAEIATGVGSEYVQAFGTFKVAEFSIHSNFGVSYRIGPGDVILDIIFLKGLSDTHADRFLKGTTFSYGGSIGYSIYL